MRTLSAGLLIVVVVSLLCFGYYVYHVDSEESVWLGKVVKVVDGDTYWVEWVDAVGADSCVTSVRPYLINCPEIYHIPPECFGGTAAQYCWNLLLGRYVWIAHYGRHSGDRLLAFIYLDSARTVLLQTLLIAQGFARADIRHPEEDRMKELIAAAEAQAKSLHLGLWGVCEPSPSGG